MKIRYIEIKNFRGIKNLATKISGNFSCLIGSGDSGKSSIITAIDYTLSPRWNVTVEDTDFYNQNIDEAISIAVTLGDWDPDNSEVRKFFAESRFGQYIGGLRPSGPTAEPADGMPQCITVLFQVDKSLEPKWFVQKGADLKPIPAGERSIFGIGRIDTHLDNNFTWGRNTLLTRLSTEGDNINAILANIARGLKDAPLSLTNCETTAGAIKTESEKFGVKVTEIVPKIDLQKLSFAAGALALHNEDIPLRNLGTGSKKLISCAMQLRLHDGRNIALIDELELGLEPHRIRGLIKNLKETQQQVITTTHSPVVLRELIVDELYVCRIDSSGSMAVKPLAEVPDSQGPVRSNPEAFLGRKVVVCEGQTEVGCLRALDNYKMSLGEIPVWTLNTAYFNAGGSSKIQSAATALKSLGYDVAVLADSDDQNNFSNTSVAALEELGVKVFIWPGDRSIEQQLFADLTWSSLDGLMTVAANAHDSKSKTELIQAVKDQQTGLADNPADWPDTSPLREVIGNVAAGKLPAGSTSSGKKGWFKRINSSEAVFKYALPNMNVGSPFNAKLDLLWGWIQDE